MVPNKLIQLLFTVETKLWSKHSSKGTKKPDLVQSRANVRFGAWAAIQAMNSYLKRRLFHTPFENKRQRGHNGSVKGDGWNSSLKHMPSTDHFLSTGVALLGKNEINCPTTAVWSREAQSLSWPTTVSFMFPPPKPQLLHFGESWIWCSSWVYFCGFYFGRDGLHCCGLVLFCFL